MECVEQCDALNRCTTTVYDAAGRRTAVIDAAGNATRFEYDPGGRLLQTVHADPDGEDGDNANNPRTSVAYDDAGRKVAEMDEQGVTRRYAYDLLGTHWGQVDNRTTQTHRG